MNIDVGTEYGVHHTSTCMINGFRLHLSQGAAVIFSIVSIKPKALAIWVLFILACISGLFTYLVVESLAGNFIGLFSANQTTVFVQLQRQLQLVSLSDPLQSGAVTRLRLQTVSLFRPWNSPSFCSRSVGNYRYLEYSSIRAAGICKSTAARKHPLLQRMQPAHSHGQLIFWKDRSNERGQQRRQRECLFQAHLSHTFVYL